MVKRRLVRSVDDILFPALWEIYENSFPLCERRSLENQVRIFANDTFLLEVWEENGVVLGFIGWWKCDGLRYVEHYAINPICRSAGYGHRFLAEWLEESSTPVLLEIEPVKDELTKRRQSFYHRLSFHDNPDIEHWQPPHHKETRAVHLWIMSYPNRVSHLLYERFREKLGCEIIGC